MNEINIAKILISKRKNKGITQDDLASYIGVSKASVSKWETEKGYPDITFLPRLATYFNISIDELMGYAPQLSKEDIQQLYYRLAKDFSTKPFDEVIDECRSLIKKYYSCFPLLLQMVVLFMNHVNLAPSPDQQKSILNEAIQLCNRINSETDDASLAKEVVSAQAACYLMSNQPQEVLDLLGEDIKPFPQDTEAISQAYLMMGNTLKAKEVTQICIYQHLLSLEGLASQYLLLNVDDMSKIDEILYRTLGVAELYNIDYLHPNVMLQIYLASAQTYCAGGNIDKSLDMLGRFMEICITKLFPVSLHGDDYFDAIEHWLEDFDLGTAPPRSESLIKESVLQCVIANPAFAVLADEPGYKTIVEKLKLNLLD